MEFSASTAGLVDNPKRVLLDLAGQHQLSELLPLAVNRLAAGTAVALVRIWLIHPPIAGECSRCRFANECHARERCLHLAASAGQSLDASAVPWSSLEGAFRRFPIGVRKVGMIAQSGQSIELANVTGGESWVADPDWVRRERITSFAGHPLVHRGQVLGVLGLFARQEAGEACFEWLRMIADHLAAAIANARALDEIERLKKRIEQENEYLREEVLQQESFGELIGQSPPLQAVGRQIDLVAPTDSSVLILGESGTGKELVARELHRRSRRAQRPFVKVNCAAIPRELYESEFFGHAKGSFTGALRDRAGRFELADGGTLFLDEVGEIPLELQAKLLRVLQEGELERVGDERTRHVDVRIISATNRKLGRPRPRLTLANVQQLQNYRWPGNVRELQHVLERAAIGASDGRLRLELPADPAQPSVTAKPVKNSEHVLTDAEMRVLEADNIQKAMRAAGGKIYGADGAAALLGIKPTTLASRIKALRISVNRPGFEEP